MDGAQRRVFHTHRTRLKKSLFLGEGVLDYLVSKDVIGESAVEQIIQSEHGRKRNNSEQTEELLKILPFSCSSAFNTFIEALNDSELVGHKELAATLVRDVESERSAQATLAPSSHGMAAAIDWRTQFAAPYASDPLPDPVAFAPPMPMLQLPPGHRPMRPPLPGYQEEGSDEQMLLYQQTSRSYQRRIYSTDMSYGEPPLDRRLMDTDVGLPDNGGDVHWAHASLDRKVVHCADDRQRMTGSVEAAMFPCHTSLPLPHLTGNKQRRPPQHSVSADALLALQRRAVQTAPHAVEDHLQQRSLSVGFVDEPFAFPQGQRTTSTQQDRIGKDIIEAHMDELGSELVGDYDILLEELIALQAFTSAEVLELCRMSPERRVYHLLTLLKAKDSSTFNKFLRALLMIQRADLFFYLHREKKSMWRRVIWKEDDVDRELLNVWEGAKCLDQSALSARSVACTSFDASGRPGPRGEELVSEALCSATCFIMIDEVYSRRLKNDASNEIATLLKEAGIDPKKCTAKILEFAEANIVSINEPAAKRRKDSPVLVRIKLDISLDDELLEMAENAIKKCLEGFLGVDQFTVYARRRGSVILVLDMPASAVTKLYGIVAEQPGLLAGLGVLELGCLGRAAQLDVQARSKISSQETCDGKEHAKTRKLADKLSGVLSEDVCAEVGVQSNLNAAVKIAVKAAFPNVDVIQRFHEDVQGQMRLDGVSKAQRSPQHRQHPRRQCDRQCECPGPCGEPCVKIIEPGDSTHEGHHDCGAEHRCSMECQYQYQALCEGLCTVSIAPGQLRHGGKHMCKDHRCETRCPYCGSGCNRVHRHVGKCDTVHGTVSKATLETTYKSDGDVVEFPSNDVQCDTMCRVAGDSHYHLAKDCKCFARQPPEQRRHDPASTKDFMSHNRFWMESNFMDPYEPTESEKFNACPVVCTLEGHDGTNMPRKCTGKLFHKPVTLGLELTNTDGTAVIMGPRQKELSGHRFPCTEHQCGGRCDCGRPCSHLNHAMTTPCACLNHTCCGRCRAEMCNNWCMLPCYRVSHKEEHECEDQQCTAMCCTCGTRRCAVPRHPHCSSPLLSAIYAKGNSHLCKDCMHSNTYWHAGAVV